jgi:pimeloyl-ACP methyl ester carboxylesterase
MPRRAVLIDGAIAPVRYVVSRLKVVLAMVAGMSVDRVDIPLADGTVLVAERRRGSGPTVVLLHAGVADRRSWSAVIEAFDADDLNLVAYDRRGFGETLPAGDGTFTHLADLSALLDALEISRTFLVGNSMGGALALDLAATAPERVAGVLLIGAAVSGMTDDDTPFDWAPDAASGPILEMLEEAKDRGDVDTQVRALAHLWLDGPSAREGRVGGASRALFEDMNRGILAAAAPDDAGDAGLDTWRTLDRIAVPVLAAWGDLDIPADIPFYEETARRIGQGPGRTVPGVAHLPGLEEPALVADLVREVVRSDS